LSYFIEFPTETDGLTILIEADAAEVQPPPGVEKAGLLPRRRESIAVATERFDIAIRRVVKENVSALTDAVKDLAVAPSEVELTFGLKATGEFGNIAVAKVGAEATFEIRLLWKGPAPE
jgi:hypothetical protein